jgi:hypothetical protein
METNTRPDLNRREETVELGPGHETPGERRALRSIDLDVVGANLMLKGRFSDWDSALTLGSNLDHVGLQLAVDATSASEDRSQPDLFSFHSRSVEAHRNRGSYTAHGVLTGPAGSKPMDIEVRTPPGHSALFMLSLMADKSDFGEGWRDLIERDAPWQPPAEGEPTRQAYAWLMPPVLAAA